MLFISRRSHSGEPHLRTLLSNTLMLKAFKTHRDYTTIIGIDPDCGEHPDEEGIATTGGCGVCTLHVDWTSHRQPQVDVKLETRPFFDIVDYLRTTAAADPSTIVIVEASWLNQSGTANWHINGKYSSKKNAAIGHDVGRCHEVGRKLIEACRYYSIDYEAKRPLRKLWTGKDGKITDAEIRRFIPITKSRTNQEERDAALLAWDYALLPIKIFAGDKVPTKSEKRRQNARKRP